VSTNDATEQAKDDFPNYCLFSRQKVSISFCKMALSELFELAHAQIYQRHAPQEKQLL
jgi:hypothetical protein